MRWIFDGSIVKEEHPYDDVETPLEFIPGVQQAVPALKRAGHVLLLWSGRASRALLFDPMLDPLVRAGVVPLDMERWRSSQSLHQARYRQMLDFVAVNCIGWFDAIDDGAGGKPMVDLYLDNQALRLGRGMGGVDWRAVSLAYGAPELAPATWTEKRGAR